MIISNMDIQESFKEKEGSNSVCKKVRNMYDGASTNVRSNGRFQVKIGFYHRSESYLYLLVMNELRKGVQNEAPLCMSFADDVVLIDQNTNVLSNKLERW